MSTPAAAQDLQGVAPEPAADPRQAAKANFRQSMDFVKQVQVNPPSRLHTWGPGVFFSSSTVRTNPSPTYPKATYDPQSETYKEFLTILQQYLDAVRADSAPGERDERMVDALERIKKLFDGNDDLIEGLDTFWPEGYKKQE